MSNVKKVIFKIEFGQIVYCKFFKNKPLIYIYIYIYIYILGFDLCMVVLLRPDTQKECRI